MGGSCYKNLGNISMSIKSYQRAESVATNSNPNNSDVEYKGCVLQLAKLYAIIKAMDKSKKQYAKYIAFIQSPTKMLNDNEIEALIKLSEMCLNESNFVDAVKFAQRI